MGQKKRVSALRPSLELLESRVVPSTSNPLLTYADPINSTGDSYGESIETSGSNLLVGAYASVGGSGAAYLYGGSGELLETMTDPDLTDGDNFGNSVALTSSNVLVGAVGIGKGKGAVYLYDMSGDLLQTFTDPNNTAGDNFGSSVALSGNNVLVGAPGVGQGKGAVYLYSMSGQLLHTFTDPNNTSGDRFGNSLALSGSDVLVGAYGVSGVRGAVYIYSTSGQLLHTFTDPNNTAADFFGCSVALSGSDLLVGAIGVGGAGAAYLYTTSGQLLQTFTDPNNDIEADFGVSVALAGSDVLVGANGVGGAGAAYLYSTSGQLLQSFTDPNNDFGNAEEDDFGVSVALSGSNVMVGASGTNSGMGNVYEYSTPSLLSGLVGNNGSTIVGTPFGTALEVQVSDSFDNTISDATVTFTESNGTSGAGATFTGSTTVITNSQGLVIAPLLTANDTAGSFTVTATLGSLSTTFLLNNASGAAAGISTLGGTPQNAPVGSAFGTLLQALVTDSYDNPVASVPVTFAVPAFGPAGTFNATATVLSNAQGIATAPALTANHTPGTFTVTAAAAGVASPADFTLTNTLAPAAIKVVSGSGQHATVNTAFAKPLQVMVTTSSKQPVSGITVDFEVPGSGASGTFALGSVVTNANGVATLPTLTANTVAGNWTVDAWVAGVATPAAFKLTNVAGPAQAISSFAGNNQSANPGKAFGTLLQAQVVDSYGNPVSGASVTFTIVGNSGSDGKFANGKTTVVETTGANGVAKAPALTANAKPGSFTVTATVTVNGVLTGLPFTYDLTIL